MPTQDTPIPDEIPGLLDSLELVNDALALVHLGLGNNPSMDQARTLNQQELRLAAERDVLKAEIDSAINGQAVQGPTTAQHAAISALSAQVEAATQANAAATQTIALASLALGLLTQVVTT